MRTLQILGFPDVVGVPFTKTRVWLMLIRLVSPVGGRKGRPELIALTDGCFYEETLTVGWLVGQFLSFPSEYRSIKMRESLPPFLVKSFQIFIDAVTSFRSFSLDGVFFLFLAVIGEESVDFPKDQD